MALFGRAGRTHNPAIWIRRLIAEGSQIITRRGGDENDRGKNLPPMHPGRVLELEFLKPLGLTPYKLAKEIGVPAPRVYDIVRGKRGISADTALRLARFFGTSAWLWMNLQTHYDLEIEEDRVGDSLEKEIQPFAYTPPE